MFIDSEPLVGRDMGPSNSFPAEGVSRFRRNLAPTPNRSSDSSYATVAKEVDQNRSSEQVATKVTSPDKSEKSFSLWEKSDVGFGDFLDIINPLQHVPIVATIYRNLTGDQIGVAPRIIGGALWGRIGGLVAGVVNAVVQWFTGKDIGDHIYAAIWGKSGATEETSTVAQAARPPISGHAKVSAFDEPVELREEQEALPIAVPSADSPSDSGPLTQDTALPTLSKLSIPSERIIPSHILSRYFRDEERNPRSDSLPKLRLSA